MTYGKTGQIIYGLILTLILFQGHALYAHGSNDDSGKKYPSLYWGSIDVLDLKTAQQIALADNPSIHATETRVRQAKERISQAQSAYWPRLDATASASRVWMSENSYQENLDTARIFNPGATIDDPQDYYRTGLTATWLLFDGFERRYKSRLAQNTKNQLVSARDDAKRLLLSSVAVSFLGAELARENINIAISDEAFFKRLLEEAKSRRQVGMGSLSDELSFQVQVNAAVSARIRSEGLYKARRHSLAALLGLTDALLPAHVVLAPLEMATAQEMAEPDAEQMVSHALAYRPELLQSLLAIQNATLERKMANAKYSPSINLTAGVSGDREADAGFENDDFGNSVGLNLTFNLFSGGLYRAQAREARQKEFENRKTLEALKTRITADVRAAVVDVITFQTQLRLQESNTRLVQENRDLVEKEYRAGQVSLVRLNEAQRELTSSQTRTASALVALRQSWYSLMSETGQLTEDASSTQ